MCSQLEMLSAAASCQIGLSWAIWLWCHGGLFSVAALPSSPKVSQHSRLCCSHYQLWLHVWMTCALFKAIDAQKFWINGVGTHGQHFFLKFPRRLWCAATVKYNLFSSLFSVPKKISNFYVVSIVYPSVCHFSGLPICWSCHFSYFIFLFKFSLF